MKKKQKQTIKEKTVAELHKMIGKEREIIVKSQLKFDEEKNKNILRTKKRDIARMLTYIKQQEMKG
jgi:ribosomal protein L29